MYLLNVVEKCICIKQITQSTAVFSTFVTLLPRASHAEHELTRPHSCKNGEQSIIFTCLLNTNKLQGATFGYPTMAECSGKYLIVQKHLKRLIVV